MTQKNKDKVIQLLIGIVSGCAIVLFGTFWNAKEEAKNATKNDIDFIQETKVDKTDFEIFKGENKAQHKEIKEDRAREFSIFLKHIDKRFDDQETLIIQLNKKR